MLLNCPTSLQPMPTKKPPLKPMPANVKPRPVKRRKPASMREVVTRIYGHMIVDLRSNIEASTPDNSIRGFVLAQEAKKLADPEDPTAHTFEIRNLYRVFSKDNPQQMSLNLYIRLCQALGIGGARMMSNKVTDGNNETLIDFLSKDREIIWLTVLDLQYDGA